MDKAQTIHAFWSKFGLDAYDETTVPDGADAPEFPYITYQVVDGSFGDNVPMAASLWYHSSSWQDITQKADEISNYIGLGGRLLQTNNGAAWIRRGTPFAQRMSDDSDRMIRRMYLNIYAEFITEN